MASEDYSEDYDDDDFEDYDDDDFEEEEEEEDAAQAPPPPSQQPQVSPPTAGGQRLSLEVPRFYSQGSPDEVSFQVAQPHATTAGATRCARV